MSDNLKDKPAPGDLYIAEHRMWRDKFSIVRIEQATSHMAVMATYRPRTKYDLVGEGKFEKESRRRKLNNLRQKLPLDTDVAAISAEIERLFKEQNEAHKKINADYLASIAGLG